MVASKSIAGEIPANTGRGLVSAGDHVMNDISRSKSATLTIPGETRMSSGRGLVSGGESVHEMSRTKSPGSATKYIAGDVYMNAGRGLVSGGDRLEYGGYSLTEPPAAPSHSQTRLTPSLFEVTGNRIESTRSGRASALNYGRQVAGDEGKRGGDESARQTPDVQARNDRVVYKWDIASGKEIPMVFLVNFYEMAPR
jgi:hypothetical protein